MIVDASALLALLLREEDAERHARAIEAASVRRMSAINWMEAAVRIDRAGKAAGARAFDEIVAAADIEIIAADAAQAVLARRAYGTYGKGSGHRAGLNLGDCFAYALAKSTGEPLLFKGEDFVHTDIEPA